MGASSTPAIIRKRMQETKLQQLLSAYDFSVGEMLNTKTSGSEGFSSQVNDFHGLVDPSRRTEFNFLNSILGTAQVFFHPLVEQGLETAFEKLQELDNCLQFERNFIQSTQQRCIFWAKQAFSNSFLEYSPLCLCIVQVASKPTSANQPWIPK